MAVNRSIILVLLQKLRNLGELVNLRCQLYRRTALHSAIEAANVDGVELLLGNGADSTICDDLGLTPVKLAQKLLNDLHDEDSRELDLYAAIIDLLL